MSIDETAPILDVGGTVSFSENAGFRGNISILNLEPTSSWDHAGYHYVQGDARDLSRYHDFEFDVVFSNSVIEHVGDPEDQEAMAREIRRVGRNYFVQVPNRNFPIEPHFLFPCFQFMPLPMRLLIAKHWPLGWYRPGSDPALYNARTLRLLNCSNLTDSYTFRRECLPLSRLSAFKKAKIFNGHHPDEIAQHYKGDACNC